jgi:hypothetical protein
LKASPENTFLDSKESLKELADELQVSPRRLVQEIISQRRIVAMEQSTPKRELDQNNAIAVNRHSDKMAEKFGTVKPDITSNLGEYAIVRATAFRDSMRKDPAAIAARKIIRALPLDCDCVVTTKVGYDVVTINRVESVPSPELIQIKLESAQIQANRANAQLRIAQAAADAKTVLNRVPKELKQRVERRAAVADKFNARVAELRKELAFASKGHSANGKRYVAVGDVRLSLKAQYMANRVAKLARIIPVRNDVHPFRELPTIHAVTATTFVGGIESPEQALLRYEREVERQAELEKLLSIDRAKRAAEIAAMVEAYDAQFKAELRNQRIALNKAKKALYDRNRRRDAKLANR